MEISLDNLGKLGGGVNLGCGKKTIVPIVFAADAAYYRHTAVMLASILDHNPDLFLDVYVLTDREDIHESRKMLTLHNRYRNFTLRFIEIDDSQFAALPVYSHFPVQMYYRFLIPHLLPDIDKAVYFDGDMICTGSIKELYETPLENHYAAAVDDLTDYRFRTKNVNTARLPLPADAVYVNSGMLLMNLKQIRQDAMTAKLFEDALQLADTVFLQYPDQDVINYTFAGRIKILDSRWNKHSREKSASAPVIYHWTGSGKPWNYTSKHPAAVRHWFQYFRQTPFYNRGAELRYYFYAVKRLCSRFERMIRKISRRFARVCPSIPPETRENTSMPEKTGNRRPFFQ